MDDAHVYRFEVYDIKTDRHIMSERMALASTIEKITGARMIRDSGMRIDPKYLDGDGFVRRPME